MTTVAESMEEAEAPISTRMALGRAFREAPTLRRGVELTLLLAVLGTAGQLVVPIAVQQIVDREVLAPEGPDLGAVMVQGAAALLVLVLAAVISRSAVLRLNISTAGGLKELRVKLFGHLHKLSILHVQAERRGALVSRVTNDITTIQEFMEWGGIGMVIGIAQVMLALAVMFV
jgi:putative ABC transport system ATP-binding protein